MKSAFGNGRDLNRSRDEAQRVLAGGAAVRSVGTRQRMDNRVASEWSQIQQELRIISDAYGLGYGNGGYYPNGRNLPQPEWQQRLVAQNSVA